MNLIPKGTPCGNYLCTWEMQYFVSKKIGKYDEKNPVVGQRDSINYETLFGKDNSLLNLVEPKYRGELYLVLDDGWDVPFGCNSYEDTEPQPYGALSPHPERFPFSGNDTERLTQLVREVKKLGYAGTGLWIPTQMLGERKMDRENKEFPESYWIEKAKMFAAAGISYLKIDWGLHGEPEYRRNLTRVFHKYCPDVLVEHACCQGPFTNPDWPKGRRETSIETLKFSDVFRLYDVLPPFHNVAMLSRADEVLSGERERLENSRGNLNAEICTYLAAALGFNIGIMQYKREDEAAIRWQRIAPPFSVYDTDYKRSEEILTDEYFWHTDPVFWFSLRGKWLRESAPAIMARGCELPKVSPRGGDKPFVLASKNPKTGAYSICTLKRNINPNTDLIVLADIEMNGETEFPIGVFGYFGSLKIDFGENIEGKKVFAQDILGDEAFDITDKVEIKDSFLYISGENLRLFGTAARPTSEQTDPSLIIKII